MLKDKFNTFDATLNREDADGTEELGIDLISNVANPAVRIKGVAFTNQHKKHQCFTDNLKHRIIAPVLVPGDVYRNDEDGEYMITFTPEIIEEMAMKFMSELSTKNNRVFNLEHSETVMVDSYILECILVDSESKRVMLKTDYNLEVPLGSFVVVQQFNDVDKYNELVKNGQTGFSFEGYLGLKLSESINKQKFSTSMKKRKFEGVQRTFKTASKKVKLGEVVETNDLVMIADELVEGAVVIVVEDSPEGLPTSNVDFSGEVDVVIDGVVQTVIIEGGKVTEVVMPEVEVPIEGVPVVAEVELAEEVVEEVIIKEEALEEVPVVIDEIPSPITTDIEAKFTEVYDMIAELKAEISQLRGVNEVVVEDGVYMNKQRFTNALAAFTKWSSEK